MKIPSNPDILYTKVDEAPELASASLLPIIQSFAAAAGVIVGTKDISLAGRIISAFSDFLTDAQRQSNDLVELGDLVKTPEVNIIKLPNISASVPQLIDAIEELQSQGYKLPDYPEAPATDLEKSVRMRYDAIKGSAVNPILREGNSDRRAASAVKKYAMKNPHSMGEWVSTSKTHVASMQGNDFRSNEVSATLSATQAGPAKIEFTDISGNTQVLKGSIDLLAGTVVDATFMRATALRAFLEKRLQKPKLRVFYFLCI